MSLDVKSCRLTILRRVSALLVALALSSGQAWGQVNAANRVAQTFATLKSALAIVATKDGVGTAFCISSTSNGSAFLTNAHVVGDSTSVTVFQQFPQIRQIYGRVVARGVQDDPDLAVIEVDVGNLTSVALRVDTPREGDGIADAGYPVAQYTLAKLSGDLTPSVHVGTISAIVNRGGIIEFDAQTLPGNSGGPLFDPETGGVLGVVQAKLKGTTEANIAIGMRTITEFLRTNNIAFSTSNPVAMVERPQTTAIIPPLAGSGTVVVVYYNDPADGQQVAAMNTAAAQDFGKKFAARFGVRTVFASEAWKSPGDLAAIARRNGAIAAVDFNSGFNQIDNSYRLTTEYSLEAGITDLYGATWWDSTKGKRAGGGTFYNITGAFGDLSDQVIAELYRQASSDDPTALANFFRYALPIKTGGKQAFFGLKPSQGGALATYALPFGPAAEAGLQSGDTVITINGQALSGLDQSQIDAALASGSASGGFDLLILTADGQRQHLKFEPKDIRWYLSRRALPASS